MPSWGAVAWSVTVSAAVATRLRFTRGGRQSSQRQPSLLVFAISFEDTGLGVFATALATLLLGCGPVRTDPGRRLALTAGLGGLAARLVDSYLY